MHLDDLDLLLLQLLAGHMRLPPPQVVVVPLQVPAWMEQPGLNITRRLGRGLEGRCTPERITSLLSHCVSDCTPLEMALVSAPGVVAWQPYALSKQNNHVHKNAPGCVGDALVCLLLVAAAGVRCDGRPGVGHPRGGAAQPAKVLQGLQATCSGPRCDRFN